MTEQPEQSVTERLDEIQRNIAANQHAAEELFVPSPVMERLLWQVCGAWETVIEEVRFFRFMLHENPSADPPTPPPFIRPDGENVARDMRRIAKQVNLRLPSEHIWTPECKAAKAMRDDLGHMLHFKTLEGESPNQTVTLLRVPYKEPDEMTIVDGWARHNRKTVTITERDAREVLAGLKYVKASIFALRKFGMEFGHWPDTMLIHRVLSIMPWWLDDWGPQLYEEGFTMPTMRQLRIAPKAEYDETLPPDRRSEL